jgi:hypothetical protein
MMTSVPVGDDSLPPVVVHLWLRFVSPLALARSLTTSPDLIVEVGAPIIWQVTDGQGGSVISNDAAQVVWPLVTHSSGKPESASIAVTTAVTV